MPNYIIMTYGQHKTITAENKATAIKAAKEYAKKNNVCGFIVMNSRADIIYSQDKDGSEIPVK